MGSAGGITLSPEIADLLNNTKEKLAQVMTYVANNNADELAK